MEVTAVVMEEATVVPRRHPTDEGGRWALYDEKFILNGKGLRLEVSPDVAAVRARLLGGSHGRAGWFIRLGGSSYRGDPSGT